MRRPCGALLLGALLCAHGKRRRRARAHPPARKVCPRAPAAAGLNLPRAERRGLGPESPSPSHSKHFARRSCAGERDRELSTPPPPTPPARDGAVATEELPGLGSGPGWVEGVCVGGGEGVGGRSKALAPSFPRCSLKSWGAFRFGLTHGLCVFGANECVRRKAGKDGR